MKKRLFGLILTSVMLLTLLPLTAVAAPAATLDGGGTEENPYLIEDETDLKNFAENANTTAAYGNYYKIVNDITVKETWTPMDTFYGTLLGNDCKITLEENVTGGGNDENVGFVRILYGTIQDLTIDGTFSGGNYVGAFAGRLSRDDGLRAEGKIKHCATTANTQVKGTNHVGGIVGGVYSNLGLRVENSINRGSVTGKEYVGGIMGEGGGMGTVIECDCNFGDVKGEKYVGGIMGKNNWLCEGCFNAGTVTGDEDEYYGPVIGGSDSPQYDPLVGSFFISEDPDETDEDKWPKPITTKQANSGELCWKLNDALGRLSAIYGQKLDGDGKDNYPVPGKIDEFPVYRLQFFAYEGDDEALETQYHNPGDAITKPKAPTQPPANMNFKFWSIADYGNDNYPRPTGEFTNWETGFTADEVKSNKDFPLYAAYEVAFEQEENSNEPVLTYNQYSEINLNDYVQFAVEQYENSDKFNFEVAKNSELPKGLKLVDGKISGTVTADAGKYEVTFDVTDKMGPVIIQTVSLDPGAAYGSAKLTLTFEVKKADSVIDTAPAAKEDLTYDGSEQALVTPGTATGGTVVYSLDRDGPYTDAIPTGTEAKEYTVWYKVEGDEHYNGIEPQSVTVTIKPYVSPDPGPSLPTTYDVTVTESSHGGTSTSPRNPSAGTSVTLTVTPDDGWTVDSVTVTRERNGETVEVTDNGDGTYSFLMPSGPVTVTVTFACGRGAVCPMYPYKDADRQAWYHDGVHYCVEHSLMVGVGAGAFDPEGVTTRAQMAQILYNLEGQPSGDLQASYIDVPEDAWYTGAVSWATGEGIMDGYGGGRFGPNDPVTREQAAVILYRYAGYKGRDVSKQADLTGFTDAGAVSDWAVAGMRWAVGEALIAGIGQNALAPSNGSSRATVATILARYCEAAEK